MISSVRDTPLLLGLEVAHFALRMCGAVELIKTLVSRNIHEGGAVLVFLPGVTRSSSALAVRPQLSRDLCCLVAWAAAQACRRSRNL